MDEQVIQSTIVTDVQVTKLWIPFPLTPKKIEVQHMHEAGTT